MPKRKLRIVKRDRDSVLGICERCNAQFTANSDEWVDNALANHKCKPTDSSQNALRIVREATEDK